MRASLLATLALAFAATASAAPAPFSKPQPAQPEVRLNGWLPDERLAAGGPVLILSRADWLSAAAALGIAQPPATDFRTHFLVAHVSSGFGGADFDLDGRGGLRLVPRSVSLKCGLAGRSGAKYEVRSFPRSAVRTVNGEPLPRK